MFIRGLYSAWFCVFSLWFLSIAAMAEAPEYVIGLFVAPLLLLVAVGVNDHTRKHRKDSYHRCCRKASSASRKTFESKTQRGCRHILVADNGRLSRLSFSMMLGTWIVRLVAGVLFAAVSHYENDS